MPHRTASAWRSARSQAPRRRSVRTRMRRLSLAAALVAAASVLPVTLRAQQPAAPPAPPVQQGGQVDSIEVTGNSRVTTESILNTLALPVHTTLGYRNVQHGVRALFALQQFD